MVQIEKTIMEVMKNTDNELVCSNILAFYLNPLEEHKFNELILKSLIKALSNKGLIAEEDYNYEHVSVTREYKSIDIVVLNNDYVIGIENKVNADLYNNLIGYSNILKSFNKKMINIVLSKKSVDTNSDFTGFTNITYNELAEQIDKIMPSINQKDTKWYYFLEDFIVNLRNNNTEYQYKKDKMTDKEIENIDEEIENKVEQFANIIDNCKSDNKKVKYTHNIKLDLTAYISLDGFNNEFKMISLTLVVFFYADN